MPTASTEPDLPDRPAPAARLHQHAPDDPRRDEVEAFIRRVYARRFDARPAAFAPWLATVQDEGRIMAAAGYRVASEPLFLERYLDRPIDAELAAHAGEAPDRGRIVEVGHLSAARAGEGRRLILLLAAHLAQQRIQWVTGTLTRELRHLFVRMGVTPLALCAADPARLGDEARDWGRYYAHRPLVLAGRLPPALRRLKDRPEGAR